MFQNYKNREAGWCWMNREMNNAGRALGKSRRGFSPTQPPPSREVPGP